tara:strand:+ start:350 stop:955 length:606 start_codon:yes stop_codon:yes gene_type:complete
MSLDLSLHTLKLDESLINEILEPAIDSFMGSDSYPLDKVPKFAGAGVYGLFIGDGTKSVYHKVVDQDYPIYIGKAVPSGSRQGKSKASGAQLYNRLREHYRSISHGKLGSCKFTCKFMIMNGVAEDLIPALESKLISKFHPLWNSYIDGFGIHTPGKGRFNQQPSEWDTIHPGRPWLSKLTGAPRDAGQVLEKVKSYKMRK